MQTEPVLKAGTAAVHGEKHIAEYIKELNASARDEQQIEKVYCPTHNMKSFIRHAKCSVLPYIP